jgi:hypothetical protein
MRQARDTIDEIMDVLNLPTTDRVAPLRLSDLQPIVIGLSDNDPKVVFAALNDYETKLIEAGNGPDLAQIVRLDIMYDTADIIFPDGGPSKEKNDWIKIQTRMLLKKVAPTSAEK